MICYYYLQVLTAASVCQKCCQRFLGIHYTPHSHSILTIYEYLSFIILDIGFNMLNFVSNVFSHMLIIPKPYHRRNSVLIFHTFSAYLILIVSQLTQNLSKLKKLLQKYGLDPGSGNFFCIFLWQSRVYWPLLCLYRPFCIIRDV